MSTRIFSLLAIALLLSHRSLVFGQGGGGEAVRAGTESAVELEAPRERDAFSFVIFGDRTTGSPAGLPILEEAVAMTNLLDPDLVMTIGDMVSGYNRPRAWLAQMREYKAIAKELRAPWYPVAGNHDVFGEKRRRPGNVALYREHFGPLYYSFDHRWAHFVVLYTDEPLSHYVHYLTPTQIDWLQEDLAATDAQQVFVFMHHPVWSYAGSNWSRVHELLAGDGRVEAVFAGHLHAYADHGERDGIHYYVLGATGGGTDWMHDSSQIQHIVHVRVRPDGYSSCVIPIGEVHGPDLVLREEFQELVALRKGRWLSTRDHALLDDEQDCESVFRIVVENPTARALTWRVKLREWSGWTFRADTQPRSVEAGATDELPVHTCAPPFEGPHPGITFEVTLDYPLRSGVTQPVTLPLQVPIGLADAKALTRRRPSANQALRLDGQSAARVLLGTQLDRFTLECWIKTEPIPGGWKAIVARSFHCGFGLHLESVGPVGNVWLQKQRRNTQAKAIEGFQYGEWNHLAYCWDGRTATVFVNGQRRAAVRAEGAMKPVDLPLFIGADSSPEGNPVGHLTGEIDEVRLSSVVRYEEEFDPKRRLRFKTDGTTLLLLHFDEDLNGVFLDASGHHRHAWPTGSPKLVPAPYR